MPTQGDVAEPGLSEESDRIDEPRIPRRSLNLDDPTSPLRAFRHYNFRIFWSGQIISLVGSWMQGLAQGWLILVLADPLLRASMMAHGGDAAVATHAQPTAAAQAAANYYSGLVNFANGFPLLVFILFAGVLIDRVNKRRLLTLTQILTMLCALAMGLLIRTRLITIDWVLLISAPSRHSLAYDMPARQSFVAELVGREDLPSAVVLNSSMFNAARALGPAIAGLLLASHVSLADCFFLNAASYVPVIGAMFLMRGKTLGDPKTTEAERSEPVLERLKAGLRFVRDHPTARNLIILVGSFGTFAFSFNVLIPTLVRYTLMPHAPETEQVRAFGYLETDRGLGALAGAITVAAFSSPARQKSMLIWGSLVATVMLVVFGFSKDMLWAYVTMAIVQFAFVVVFANSNTLMQLIVPDALRGRVLAIYTLMFIGTTPIGSLLAGFIAQRVGAPTTTIIFAVVSLITSLVVCFRPGGLRDLKIASPHGQTDA